MRIPFSERGTPANEMQSRIPEESRASPAGIRTILLLSRDKQFHHYLRSFANTLGLMVIRVDRKEGITSILRATRPVAVLLDVDSQDPAAWDSAELLLNEPGCPVVILLTGRTAETEMRTAMGAGSPEGRHEPPPGRLPEGKEVWRASEVVSAESSAVQRVLIGWLGASQWPATSTPTSRFWGINE